MEFMIADGWLLLGVTCGAGSSLTFVERSVMETECRKFSDGLHITSQILITFQASTTNSTRCKKSPARKEFKNDF